MVARNDAKQLGEIVELIDAATLVVDVTETHPLSDLVLVHRRSEAGHTHSKTIMLPGVEGATVSEGEAQ